MDKEKRIQKEIQNIDITIDALVSNKQKDVKDILRKIDPPFLRNWESAEGLLPQEDLRNLTIEYLRKKKKLMPLEAKLEKELKGIIERARSLGFILRYKETRIKSFNSLIRKWVPHYAVSEENSDRKDPKDHFKQFMEEYASSKENKEYDLLAARITALSLTDVAKIARLILGNEKFGWTRKNIDNFYKKPRDTGYRSWHLKTTYYPNLRSSGIKCEIQVRTSIDDAWAEWSYELVYKKPKGVAEQFWIEWTSLLNQESIEISAKLYDFSLLIDHLRERFEILRHTPPESISEFLDNLDNFESSSEGLKRLKELLPKFSHTHIQVANLKTGFDQDHLIVVHDPEGFIGLDIVRHVDKQKDHKKPEACFDFEEIRDNSRIDLIAFLSKGHRKRLRDLTGDDLVDKLVDKLEPLRHNEELLQDWKEFLKTCFTATQKYHPKNVGRRFFNEFQTRLNHFQPKGGTHLNDEFLTLFTVSTNFAFEVCTNYVKDGKRSIVTYPNSQEQVPEVKRLYKRLCEKLLTLEKKNKFSIKIHGANSIGVHVNLITLASGERELIVTRRGKGQTADTGEWQTSVSGVACPRRSSIESGGDIPGYMYDQQVREIPPSFFLSAQRELFEELGVFVPLDHIRIIALLDHTRSGQPVLVAEAYSNKPLEKIRELAKAAEEKWEIRGIQSIKLTQQNLNFLLTGRTIKMRDRTFIPPLSGTEPNPNFKWQERSQVAILLSFIRHVYSSSVSSRSGAPCS